MTKPELTAECLPTDNRVPGGIQIEKQQDFEVEIDGLRVRFALDDDYSRNWFLPRYAETRIHEPGVTRAILEALETARCFVDVGANLGWYTCLAARRMPEGIIYAFEMDAANCSVLLKNVRLNACRNVVPQHAAVAEQSGTVRYRRRVQGPSPMHRIAPDGEGTGLTEVKSIALDGFFTSSKPPPDVIKIDVEGAEAQVLGGMKRLLSEVGPALFVEVHPYHLHSFNSSLTEVLSLLINNGYMVFEIPQMRDAGPARQFRRLNRDSDLHGNTMVYASKDAQKEE